MPNTRLFEERSWDQHRDRAISPVPNIFENVAPNAGKTELDRAVIYFCPLANIASAITPTTY
jgi:hypothetical protein